MLNSYISSHAEFKSIYSFGNMEKLSKSSYWIPFFRHSNGKNSCWKTESVQGEKGCWSCTQGKVPQDWAREVEKRCWDREKEENWWPVWEGSEMEAQAVERCQRTTEEKETVFQNDCFPSRQSRTQSDGVIATLKRTSGRLISQGQDVPGATHQGLTQASIALKHLSPSTLRLYQVVIQAPSKMTCDQVNELHNISAVTEREEWLRFWVIQKWVGDVIINWNLWHLDI